MKCELLKSTHTEIEELIKLAEIVEMAEKSQTKPRKETFENPIHHTGAIRKQEYRGGQRREKTGAPHGKSRNFHQARPAQNQRVQQQQQRPSGSKSPLSPNFKQTDSGQGCFCCGKDNNRKAECTLRFKYCSECGLQGHIFKMCPSKVKKRNIQNVTVDYEDEDVDEIVVSGRYETDHDPTGTNYIPTNMVEVINFKIQDVNKNSEIKVHFETVINKVDHDYVSPQLERISINNVPIEMEADTGAAVSAISKKDYDTNFAEVPIRMTKRKLCAYNKQPIPTLGYIEVPI